MRSSTLLLRPLPVPDAERLMLVYNSYPKAGVQRASTGVPDYYDRLRSALHSPPAGDCPTRAVMPRC